MAGPRSTQASSVKGHLAWLGWRLSIIDGWIDQLCWRRRSMCFCNRGRWRQYLHARMAWMDGSSNGECQINRASYSIIMCDGLNLNVSCGRQIDQVGCAGVSAWMLILITVLAQCIASRLLTLQYWMDVSIDQYTI